MQPRWQAQALSCGFYIELRLHTEPAPLTGAGFSRFLSGGRHYSGSTTMRLRLASGILNTHAASASAAAWSTA
jgi:hypothetical protein